MPACHYGRAIIAEQAREFVVLTGQGSLKSAVEAMRYQVFDYLMKPLELDELRNVLTRVRVGKSALILEMKGRGSR